MDFGFGNWNMFASSYGTYLQNLASFGVDSIRFGSVAVILENFEVHGDFSVFWLPIRDSRDYFDVLIVRTSLCYVFGLVWVFGLEP